MALIFADGFDGYGAGLSAATTALVNSGKWAYYGGWGDANWVVQVGYGRQGGGALIPGQVQTVWVANDLPNLDEVIMGGAVQLHVLSGNDNPIFSLYDGATQQVMVGYDGANMIAQRGDGTVLATASPTNPLTIGLWHVLEVHFKIADAGGRVVVKVDGTTVIDFTGDTKNTANAYATRYYVGTVGGSNAFRIYIDDFTINTLVGDAPTGFIGDRRVENRKPLLEGATSDFTPSAGTNNALNVDENGADIDATYNESSTVGHVDLYTVQDLATSSGSVIGLVHATRWRKTDAGARTGRQVLRTDATNFEGPDVAMNDAYITTIRTLSINPDTSLPWTVSEINALEIGVKVQA
jgi:hypothetical protein